MDAHPRPAWKIAVDGADITRSIDDRLVSLTLTDNRGFEADQLDLTLDDSDGKLDLPPRGARLRLALGWQGDGLVDKGDYVVDEVEHSGAPDQLTVRARSVDLRGGLVTPMERSFHDTSVGAIVREIADENDLAPMIDIEIAQESVAHLDQTNESSANLLTRLARMFDAIPSVKDGRLLFMPAGRGKSASGKPLPVATIERQDGDQHRFTLAERDAATAVRASWYDTHRGEKGDVIWGKDEEAVAQGKKKPIAAPATPEHAPKLKALPKTYKSRTQAERACIKEWQKLKKKPGDYEGVKAAYDDKVNQVKGEVSWGKADDLRRHNAAVKTAERDAQKIYGKEPGGFDHSADNIKTLRHVYANKEDAQRAARAAYVALSRGLAAFSITLARGRPELFPDVPIAVSGFKPAIDATPWILTRVTHSVSDAGYTTALELEIMDTALTGSVKSSVATLKKWAAK